MTLLTVTNGYSGFPFMDLANRYEELNKEIKALETERNNISVALTQQLVAERTSSERGRGGRPNTQKRETVMKEIPKILKEEGGLSASDIRRKVEAKLGVVLPNYNFGQYYLRALRDNGSIIMNGTKGGARYYLKDGISKPLNY